MGGVLKDEVPDKYKTVRLQVIEQNRAQRIV